MTSKQDVKSSVLHFCCVNFLLPCAQHIMYVTQEEKGRVMVKGLSIHVVNNEEEALAKFFEVLLVH